ncbi:MAG: YqgE/AlgH family protein [Marmoricola sp.]
MSPAGDEELRAGCLLVSSPQLEGSPFARSVVLLLDVDDGGALGVVLNRPSGVPVSGVLSGWSGLVCAPDVLYSGGPVEPEGALGVAVLRPGDPEPTSWRGMFERTGVVDLDAPWEGYDAVRIYAGYSGWGPGQLQDEIAEGAWYVVASHPDDLWQADPERLWRLVLRRQRGPLSMLLTMPLDPSSN